MGTESQLPPCVHCNGARALDDATGPYCPLGCDTVAAVFLRKGMAAMRSELIDLAMFKVRCRCDEGWQCGMCSRQEKALGRAQEIDISLEMELANVWD